MQRSSRYRMDIDLERSLGCLAFDRVTNRFVLDARNTGTEDLHVTTKDFVLYARDGTVLDERVRSVLP